MPLPLLKKKAEESKPISKAPPVPAEKQKSFSEKVIDIAGLVIYLTVIPLWLDFFFMGHVALLEAICLTPMILFIGWFFRF